MTMLTIHFIRDALARHIPQTSPFRADPDHASVALALAGEPQDLQICFIRRVEKKTDPWSGHMAFPGGRACSEDACARAVAVRETREEVGLILDDSQLIGALSELPVRLGGVTTSMILSPFVYYLGSVAEPLIPNEEVAAAYWTPLTHLWDPRNGTEFTVRRNAEAIVFPAIRFHEHLIWGLTLRVITLFSDVLGQPLPHLEQTN